MDDPAFYSVFCDDNGKWYFEMDDNFEGPFNSKRLAQDVLDDRIMGIKENV
jgi:hypothetical protein